MEISKKTIVIVIVVLVAAWLLWRRSKQKTVEDLTETAQSVSRLEQLIAGAGLTEMEANIVRNFNPTGSYREWIIRDALDKGVDFESACLLNALYNKYRNADNTAFQSENLKNRYQAIYKKVLAMN